MLVVSSSPLSYTLFMRKSLCYIISFLTGGIISVMVTFNTEFGRLSTSEVSLIINQVVGIVTLEVIMLLGYKNPLINPSRRPVKWYRHYFGGLFGVAIISLNYISITGAGATIAMAGAVFGQSLMGLVFDLTGLMGMTRMRISKRRKISLLVCLAGIVTYFLGGEGLNFYLFPSILAGILTMIQMVYNSSLAKEKGAFYSARMNVISGLCGALFYALILFPSSTLEGFRVLNTIPFYIMVGGGLLACLVVVNTNMIIPRIPAVYSALLLSSGQILTALLIDYVLYDAFTPALLYGTVITLAGILLSFEKKGDASH